MNVIQISFVLMILPILSASPTGIKKRAQYLPPKSTNTTVTKPRNQDFSGTLPNKTVTADTATQDHCPAHLVAHNTSVGIMCCVPYFNCPVDHGIKACDLDGGKDQCIPCPPGMIQKNNVSSLNMEEAECYTTRNTQNCAIDDMKPSRKYSPVSSCLLKCECKNEDCHYGDDPCACNLSNPCPVNFTMNRMTGVCERCPWYAYKDYVGCGTCTVVPELWAQRNSHTTVTEKQITQSTQKKAIPEKTTKASNDTGGQAEKTESKMSSTTASILVEEVTIDRDALIGVIVAIVIVFVVLGGVVFYCLRRNKTSGSASQLITDNGPGKPAGENEFPLIEIPDGYQAVGTRPTVIKDPQPAVDKRGAEGQKLAYEELGAVGGYDSQVDDQKVPNDSFDDSPERLGAPHEEMPLLKTQVRHDGGVSQRQNVQYPEIVTNQNDDAQSPLLNDIRKGNIQIDAKSGARPKTIQPKYARQISGNKIESGLPAEIRPNATTFENCTFKKCVITTDGTVLVNSPTTEDSSLYTNDSGDYRTFGPQVKMPFEIEAVLKQRQIVPRKDRQYSDVKLELNLPPNNLDDDVTCTLSERTTSNNVSGFINEIKARDDSKYSIVKQNKLTNVLEHNSSKRNSYVDGDCMSVEETSGNDKDMDVDIADNGVENDDDQITGEKSYLDDPLTMNSAKDLNFSMLNDKVDLDKQVEKTLSIVIPKPDANNVKETGDMKNAEVGSGTTSPASSSGSENGFKRKIKPWDSDKKEEKPVARIEPIRQNSAVESRPEPVESYIQIYGDNSVSQDHENSYGLYMSEIGSDSYPVLHANHQIPDIANIEELDSLDPTSIGSSVRSQQQTSDSVVLNTEMFDNETQERGEPEGCSLQQSCANITDSYRHRPDLQRTYSKTVEGSEETNLADSIARNMSGQTFLKRTNGNSDSKLNDRGKAVSCSEFDDDLEKEKLKNLKLQGNTDHDDAVDKSKGGELSSEEETEVCKGDKSKDSEENETKSGEERVKENDSTNDNDTKVGADSEVSIELDIDCLASNETGTANADSVELPVDISNLVSDSTTDSVDDCAEGNEIDEGIRRRES